MPRTATQFVVGVVVYAISLALHLAWLPYAKTEDNVIQFFGLLALLITSYVGLLLKVCPSF